MTIALGIDPGKTGGLAVVDGLQAIEWAPMPATERETWDLVREYASLASFALIEAVTSRPGQGVVSMFTFGRGYGGLRMALVAAGVPWDAVTPQRWQGALSCRTKGRKEVTRAKAQQLFPEIQLRAKDDGIADALLIAHYASAVRLNSTKPGAEGAS